MVLEVLIVDRVMHWCLAVVVLILYIRSSYPSLAQYVADMMNGRLGLEKMMMYNFGSSSLSVKFTLLKFKKQKMASGKCSGDITLSKLS